MGKQSDKSKLGKKYSAKQLPWTLQKYQCTERKKERKKRQVEGAKLNLKRTQRIILDFENKKAPKNIMYKSGTSVKFPESGICIVFT